MKITKLPFSLLPLKALITSKPAYLLLLPSGGANPRNSGKSTTGNIIPPDSKGRDLPK